jgi:hypothetical protein
LTEAVHARGLNLERDGVTSREHRVQYYELKSSGLKTPRRFVEAHVLWHQASAQYQDHEGFRAKRAASDRDSRRGESRKEGSGAGISGADDPGGFHLEVWSAHIFGPGSVTRAPLNDYRLKAVAHD